MKKRGVDYQFPQLGGDVRINQVTAKKTGLPKLTEAGNPVIKLASTAVNLADPVARAAAKRNVLHSIDTASPETLERGRLWYPEANDAVQQGLRQNRGFLSGQFDRNLAGAAVFAGVSPNNDWEKANANALNEAAGIDSAGWDTIMAARGGKSRSALKSQEAARGIVKGMSLSVAPLANLQKAGRIVAGENPEDVINQYSAPKTFSFMHNIADPKSPHVTLDGRAMDTISNRLMPWNAGRGISGGVKAKSMPGRYVQGGDIFREISSELDMDPAAVQATSWMNTKSLEKTGGRSQGPLRIGQPYFDPMSGDPSLHDPAHYAAHRGRVAHFLRGLGA